MNVEIVLYRLASRWASTGTVDIPEQGGYSIQLDHIERGSAASYYRAELFGIGESVLPGWRLANVRLVVDSCVGQPGTLPVTWYDGEPTDWPSGLARFTLPPQSAPWERPSPTDTELPDEVWTLAFRRPL